MAGFIDHFFGKFERKVFEEKPITSSPLILSSSRQNEIWERDQRKAAE